MMNNNNKNKEIKSKINSKWQKQDKNGQDYLLLKLTNGITIFVFGTKFNNSRWSELKEGSEYTFFCEPGNNDTFLLTDAINEDDIIV